MKGWIVSTVVIVTGFVLGLGWNHWHQRIAAMTHQPLDEVLGEEPVKVDLIEADLAVEDDGGTLEVEELVEEVGFMVEDLELETPLVSDPLLLPPLYVPAPPVYVPAPPIYVPAQPEVEYDELEYEPYEPDTSYPETEYVGEEPEPQEPPSEEGVAHYPPEYEPEESHEESLSE